MEKNVRYKLVEYWNERYKTETHFEWFGDYAKYRQVIRENVKESDRVLVLGCGNSRMSEEMYLDNYEHIVNIDYSAVIVEAMRLRCQSMSQMSWMVMDIYDLKFETNSFECVLEKGTIDALLVDEKSPWEIGEENAAKMDHILQSISSFLKPNGVFISITFAQPHFRLPLYAKDKYNWSIETHTIGETFHYFVYVMRKGGKLSESDKQFYCRQSATDFNFNTLPVDLDENYLSNLDLVE